MSGRSINKLSAMKAAKLTTPGRHSDGGGLYLAVDPSGRRRWVFMYTRRGKRIELGLGGGRDLSLARAREEAAALRALLATGVDPKSERLRRQQGQSFGEIADQYIETMRPSWRNPKHADQWRMTLTKYAAPIRTLPVGEITTEEVLVVLQPLWTKIPETAERLRGRIERILDAAKVRGFRAGDNPARWRGHLDQVLPKRQRLSKGHHAALPFEQLPAFVADLRFRSAVAARALEFTILTAARSGEVLRATWNEIDVEKEVWTIPAARMKSGREHRVPLSSRAMEILSAQMELNSTGPIFSGPNRSTPLSSMSMGMLLKRMRRSNITVHGFRSTFRDWASETTTFSHEACEMALAHTIANRAEAAYRRGDLLDKRRRLMETWAVYCSRADTSSVVRLRQAARP